MLFSKQEFVAQRSLEMLESSPHQWFGSVMAFLSNNSWSIMSDKCKKIHFEGMFLAAFARPSIFARCALRYNPLQFHNALTSERLLSCRRMPTKQQESYSHVFTRRASNNSSWIDDSFWKENPREFLEDLLIADDKAGDITNKYLCIATRIALLIFLPLSREINLRERHCFHLWLHRSILIANVNAHLIVNLAYILLRHITQCDYDWYLCEMRDRKGANRKRLHRFDGEQQYFGRDWILLLAVKNFQRCCAFLSFLSHEFYCVLLM